MIDDNNNPFAILIHREFAGDVDGFLQRVGNRFHDAWWKWRGGKDEWLALMCHAPALLRTHEPKVYHCIDYHDLKKTIEQSIDECAPPIDWRVCTVPGSYQREVLSHVLPADRVTWLTLDHVWSDATLREVEARRAAKAEATRVRNHKAFAAAKEKRAAVAKVVKQKAKSASARKTAKRKAAKTSKPSEPSKPKPAKPLHPWVRGL